MSTRKLLRHEFAAQGEMTAWAFTPYSSKRSRTRTPSAFANTWRRPTVISRRPFTTLLTVCLDTPSRRPSSASLTFFSSSLRFLQLHAIFSPSKHFFVLKLAKFRKTSYRCNRTLRRSLLGFIPLYSRMPRWRRRCDIVEAKNDK